VTGDDLIVIGLCGLLGFGVVWFFLSLRNRRPSASPERASSAGAEKADHKENQVLDWYEVLEVPPTATLDEIRAAYRGKVMQYHPDRVEALGPEFKRLAETRTREINRAFEIACKARQ
jgi:DnaJ-domain-containing protein 1